MNEIVLRLVLGFFIPILIFAIIGWAPKKRRASHLYAPLGLLVFLGAFSIGATVLCTYALTNSSQEYLDDQAVWIWGILAFCFVTFLSVVDGAYRIAVWDEYSILILRLLHSNVKRKWSDLKSLERADMMQAWRLRFSDGSGFGFSDYMKGTGELVERAQEVLSKRNGQT